jgi:hypothetical protein
MHKRQLKENEIECIKNPKAPQGRYTFSPALTRRVCMAKFVKPCKGERLIQPSAFYMSPLQGFNII